MTVNPTILPNYDISEWTWSYELLRDDEAALINDYIVEFNEENPPTTTKIGSINIHTEDNNEHTDGEDSHGNLEEDGKHPLLFKATLSIGIEIDLPFTIHLIPFITEP